MGGFAYWINLAQDTNRLSAVLYAVMNLRFHKLLGISCVGEKLFSSQKLLYVVS